MEEEIQIAEFMRMNKFEEKSQQKCNFNQFNQNQINLRDLNASMEDQNDNSPVPLNSAFVHFFEKCKTRKETKEMRKQLLQTFKNNQQLENSEIKWDELQVPSLQKQINIIQRENQNSLDEQFEEYCQDQLMKKIKKDILLDCWVELENEESNQEQDYFNEEQQLNLEMNYFPQNSLNLKEQIEEEKSGKSERKLIVGTGTNLERDIPHISNKPKKEDVRSFETIQKSFVFINNQYQKREKNYEYFKCQLRTLRQDINLQGIKGEVSISMIEHNARICLENNDFSEYKRCFRQLLVLYQKEQNNFSQGYQEFTYYRLLEALCRFKGDYLQQFFSEINILNSIQLNKAFQLYQAVFSENVHLFFQLYRDMKDHGKYILNLFINKWIAWGMRILFKRYGPNYISVNLVADILGFQNIKQVLSPFDCLYDPSNQLILINESTVNLEQLGF